jgi:hypothetical protein
MKPYKVISLGMLLCLISLYLITGDWGGFGETLGDYAFPVGTVTCLIGIFKTEK